MRVDGTHCIMFITGEDLNWRCSNDSPNCQIKVLTKFSHYTVGALSLQHPNSLSKFALLKAWFLFWYDCKPFSLFHDLSSLTVSALSSNHCFYLFMSDCNDLPSVRMLQSKRSPFHFFYSFSHSLLVKRCLG